MPYPRIIITAVLIIGFTSCQFKPYSGNDQFYEVALIPEDEAPHFKNSLEWWYFTGHLEDVQSGDQLGLEYVFFHFNPLNKKDYIMVNFAISEPNRFTYDYAIRRSDTLLSNTLPLKLGLAHKNEKWILTGQNGEYHLKARMTGKSDMSIDLKTEPVKAVVLHSGTGYENYGDYATAGYYSYPRLKAEGIVEIGGEVRQVKGELWYDRQWNCIGVIEKKVSWDWISIQFDEIDSELMVYLLHHKETGEKITGGTFVNAAGESNHLAAGDIEIREIDYWKSPKSKSNYPIKWQLIIQKLELDITVEAIFPEQELSLNLPLTFRKLHYWEGKCRMRGTMGSRQVSGQSYVEITNRNI